MTKRDKKGKNSLVDSSERDIINDSNSISSLHSIQVKFNEIYKKFSLLEDDYLILKNRLKSKLFSQKGVKVSNFLSIEYLKEFINTNSEELSNNWEETIRPINIFSIDINSEIIESIAKYAYVLFNKQSEQKNLSQFSTKLQNLKSNSDRFKYSTEFKILYDLDNESSLPFLKTIISKTYSQSIISWQEFTYLYSQKKIILIDNDKDESERYYIEKASSNNISNINDFPKQIWTFNKQIWISAKNYIENNENPPNNVKNIFPFFNNNKNNN